MNLSTLGIISDSIISISTYISFICPIYLTIHLSLPAIHLHFSIIYPSPLSSYHLSPISFFWFLSSIYILPITLSTCIYGMHLSPESIHPSCPCLYRPITVPPPSALPGHSFPGSCGTGLTGRHAQRCLVNVSER